MSKQIDFLRYLKRINGDIEHKNVTNQLFKLGLKTEQHIYDFLDSLSAEKYIEWYDNRPRISDSMFIGGVHDQTAPFNFSAKLLVKGVQYLDERTLKVLGNRGTNVSAFAAVFFGLTTVGLSIYTIQKDKEISSLKNNLSLTDARLDSALSGNESLKTDLLKAKNALSAQLKKDSLQATITIEKPGNKGKN